MDTRFLQTLLTVAETGSLTRTARALNLTPSAVMQRIKVLEGEIGAPLIHRSGNAMCVTAACAAILEDARFVVGTVSHIKAAAAGRQDVGLLRVGVIHTVLSGLMPDVMLALQRNPYIFQRRQVRKHRRDLERTHEPKAGHVGRGQRGDVLPLVQNLAR